jgi:hypothetical protein
MPYQNFSQRQARGHDVGSVIETQLSTARLLAMGRRWGTFYL